MRKLPVSLLLPTSQRAYGVLTKLGPVARRDELKKARKARDQLSRKIASDAINGSDAVLSTTFGGTEKALDVRAFTLTLSRANSHGGVCSKSTFPSCWSMRQPSVMR